MFGKRIVLGIAVSLLCVAGAHAQQPAAPKPPQPTGTTQKSTHVGRDICATHPNLPQCS
jgi:hypothetical protein